jgi:ribulose 1,5-bisphosphate synthetase/thiazole synthase
LVNGHYELIEECGYRGQSSFDGSAELTEVKLRMTVGAQCGAAPWLNLMGGREVKQLTTTDVLVVGGGPAGLGAALGAASEGARTLLIEKHGFFGGTASFCLGMPINQMRPGGRPRSRVHELIIEKLQAYGDQAVSIGEHELWCNVEYLKVAALDALDAAGCRYLVRAQAVDAILEDGRVVGVVIGTKQGLLRIRAQVVVDCTGDGDVACFAGTEMMVDEELASPMTLCLNVANVDMDRATAFAREGGITGIIQQARDRYPLIPERWGLSTFPASNCFYVNHSGTKHLGIFDATDPEQLSEAECQSHRQAIQMVQAMRDFGGEVLEDIELIATGPQTGIRPRRRVKGVYVLTEKDAKVGRTFDDVVAWRSGHLDIGFVRLERMKIHDVPYRAIVPEKTDGLLMAGRCISATHVAASAGKSMGNCMATGHAAGLAAAIAARDKVQPRDLDVGELQDTLRQDGVDLARGVDPQYWLI